MRDILFRGKRVDNGEWVEGYFGKSLDTFIIQDYGLVAGYFELIKVYPETVGQYTGLTDKNGRKIFEGDIVQADDGHYRGVHGVGHYGTYDDTCIGYHIRWIDDGENRWSEWWRQDIGYWNNKVTIIGNIHDNPELIKETDADDNTD